MRPLRCRAVPSLTMTDKFHNTVLRQIADGTPYTAVDVFGPTLEFISGPDDPGADFCVMRDHPELLIGRMKCRSDRHCRRARLAT